jgi:hypothetical protein
LFSRLQVFSRFCQKFLYQCTARLWWYVDVHHSHQRTKIQNSPQLIYAFVILTHRANASAAQMAAMLTISYTSAVRSST